MENDTVERSGNLIIAIIFVAVMSAVSLLAVVITLNALGNSYDNYAGNVTETVAVINETGFTNSTGYTLAYTSIDRTSTPVLTALFNRTSGLAVGLGNATVSSVGVVTNATAVTYNNLSISYTYVHDITNATTTNIGIYSMRNNVIDMIANFFDLMPTVGTILAVVLLIAVIVLLVLYVKRMKDSGTDNKGVAFTG